MSRTFFARAARLLTAMLRSMARRKYLLSLERRRGVVVAALDMLSCVVLMYVISVAEFQTKEDMDDAIKKLDDTEFRGSYVRVAPEGDSARRSRSRSPARGRSPGHRSRSRSPAAAKESPRRSRSRSASPAAAGSPSNKASD